MATSLLPSLRFTYTSCYCEENVYLLCQQLCRSGMAAPDGSDLFVVFISNSDKTVPLWCQKAGSNREDGFVIWDYHVICIQTFSGMDKETIVWDLDTSLEIPERFPKYVHEAFRPSLNLYPNYHRLYRVISCPFFLKYFSSDRRHMKTPEGLWKMPPPPYECIHGQGSSTHNLDDYITMSRNDVTNDKDLVNVNDLKLGVVFDDEGFHKLFR